MNPFETIVLSDDEKSHLAPEFSFLADLPGDITQKILIYSLLSRRNDSFRLLPLKSKQLFVGIRQNSMLLHEGVT